MIWTDYFNLIKVQPGRIVTPRYGTLDFADPNLPVEKVKALYEEGFPYLQIKLPGINQTLTSEFTNVPLPVDLPAVNLAIKDLPNVKATSRPRKTKP